MKVEILTDHLYLNAVGQLRFEPSYQHFLKGLLTILVHNEPQMTSINLAVSFKEVGQYLLFHSRRLEFTKHDALIYRPYHELCTLHISQKARMSL